MTSFAMYVDQTIKAKGIDPIAQADRYYEEVDIAMRKQFPNFLELLLKVWKHLKSQQKDNLQQLSQLHREKAVIKTLASTIDSDTS